MVKAGCVGMVKDHLLGKTDNTTQAKGPEV